MWSAFVELFKSGLLALYNLTGNLGVGIILFTFAVRLLLLPLTIKSLRSQKRMQVIAPQLREIQRKYGKDREKVSRETLKLYKEAGVNPASGCLPVLLQLPIFFAVYQAVMAIVENPDIISRFLWLENLGKPDQFYILPILSIIFQTTVQLMATPRVQDPQQAMMTKTMLFLPVVFGLFAFAFPSGAVLYWVAGAVVSMVQQYFTNGWGSLPKYLRFLPEKQGYLSRPAMAASSNGTTVIDNVESEPADGPEVSFWSVLGKLTAESGSAPADDQEQEEELAIAAARKQLGQKRKRR
jgi:YidC/Oxa1 family membrane protein insertase